MDKKKRFIIIITAAMLLIMAWIPMITASAASGLWKHDSNGWWYSYAEGGYPSGIWEIIDDNWYHFDKNGYMQTGWLFSEDNWYYLGSNGVMQTGWNKIENNWYYLGNSGAMQTGWVQTDGKWRYLDSSGVMRTGWVISEGQWYYFDENGIMVTGAVIINDKEYFFNWSGVCIGVSSSLSRKSSIDEAVSGWQKEAGNWYYYINGKKQTGWLRDTGYWYYFDENGIMQTGWLRIGSGFYYLNDSGKAQTGWVFSDGAWYYLGQDGRAVTSPQIIDGKIYMFDSEGIWRQITYIGDSIGVILGSYIRGTFAELNYDSVYYRAIKEWHLGMEPGLSAAFRMSSVIRENKYLIFELGTNDGLVDDGSTMQQKISELRRIVGMDCKIMFVTAYRCIDGAVDTESYAESNRYIRALAAIDRNIACADWAAIAQPTDIIEEVHLTEIGKYKYMNMLIQTWMANFGMN